MKTFQRYSYYTPRTLFVAASAPLDHAARAGRSATSFSQRPATRASAEPQDDLKSLVLRLSSQVEQLTAIVAEQQQHQQQQGQDRVEDENMD
jgi:hypothetical protein